MAPTLGSGTSPTNGRFYYKTVNDNAMIFLIVGLVFFIVNWVACLICWVGICFVAFSQESFALDFNDATGNVEVKKVGTITNSVKQLHSIPYSKINSAATIDTNTTVSGQPGKIVILNLADGTTIEVAPAEPQTLAETRCNLLNQHLAAAKGGAPTQPVQQQQQTTTTTVVYTTNVDPHAAQQQAMMQPPMQQAVYSPPMEQQQYNPNYAAPPMDQQQF